MTLAECIDQYQQRQPAPIGAVLTPKGAAVLAVYRLRRQLAAPDPADRSEVAAMLADEICLGSVEAVTA
jgi:hypothetical protein